MKIALINGSPKHKNSASGILAEQFAKLAKDNCECFEIKMNRFEPTEEMFSMLGQCDTWILFYPLYVDGVPGHFVSCLEAIEKSGYDFGEKSIYAVSNCGFYDGRQCEWSLDIIRNWSRRTGFTFLGGIGFGGGGAVPEVYDTLIGRIITSTYLKALKYLVQKVLAKDNFENFYASINMPRFVLKLAAEIRWGRTLVKNGKKKKDISYIPQ